MNQQIESDHRYIAIEQKITDVTRLLELLSVDEIESLSWVTSDCSGAIWNATTIIKKELDLLQRNKSRLIEIIQEENK